MVKPNFREGTWDWNIFIEIVLNNEYRLPKKLKNIKVIDIGGHIGSFSWLCAKKEANEIFFCEALKENYDIGIKWIEESFWNQKITKPVFATFNAIIWKDDNKEKLTFNKCNNEVNTGGGSCITDEIIPIENQISTFPFDDIIKLRLNKVNGQEKVLLKLDCEGSEYPILFSSKELNKIDYICGEYHEINNIPVMAKVDGYDEYNARTLQKFLKENGFLYTYFDKTLDEHDNKTNLGHFWASKTKEPFFIEIELKEDCQENI